MTYKRPDHYTKKAKAAGFAARSVFKLDEIEERFHILPRSLSQNVAKGAPGGVATALDLGCYPGSWSRWLQLEGMRVVGVDLLAPEFTGEWITASALDIPAETLLERMGGPADLLVSDMAPSTSGNRFTDHCRQIALATRALELCGPCLKPGGNFVVKVFDGEDAPAFGKAVEAMFGKVRRFKPEATRDRSVEFFLVGTGKRG